MADKIMLLLVEDEALIRLHLQEELTDKGFELVVAATGAQALAELEVDAARFRGLLTDIKVGAGPDGWDLAERARSFVPAIPVVYMSGDSGHLWTVKGVPNSIMVTKPFVTAQIITAISTLLNQTDSH